MSIDVMSAVFKRYPNGGGEMLLALALADHAHDDGTHVFPFVNSLAEKTRQSVRAVQYQLRRMQEAGWLILVNAGNGGRGQPSEYRINPDWLKGADFSQLKRVQSDAEKGADSDIKGANDDKKGCNPLHPHITVNEPSSTIKEPSKRARKSKFDAAEMEVPSWLSREAWADWAEDRRERRKPLTAKAAHLQIQQLDAYRKEGFTPESVIQNSIAGGYQGLFPPRNNNKNGGRPAPAPENFKEKAYVGTDEAEIDWL